MSITLDVVRARIKARQLALIGGLALAVRLGAGSALQLANRNASTSCVARPPDIVASEKAVGPSSGPAPSAAQMSALDAYLEGNTDVDAGMVAGPDGRMYLGFTTDAAGHLAALRRLVPEPQLVAAWCAPYSIQQVTQTTDEAIAYARGRGFILDGSKWPALDGRDDMGLSGHATPSTIAAIRHRFGDIIGTITVGPAQCGAMVSCPI